MPPPSLQLQTTYAELVDRCAATAFEEAFAADGTFVAKTVKNRRYWYFQQTANGDRTQRYVGPETPELLERIAHHRQVRNDERQRRALIATLVRVHGAQRPVKEIGDVIGGLAKAGVFRLRGVLVGTVAYQTYALMLGTRLPHAMLQTGDVDIAQFKSVSVAVGEQIPPVLDVLKEADATFRPVPHIRRRSVTSYRAAGGLRVDFLTPNEGRDTDTPQRLPALQTEAEPLRFLDFLIREPEHAVLLHEAGIYVLVPAPQRYAVHKLIVSRRRPEGAAKRDKDIRQAAALFDILVERRPYELKSSWHEAFRRGATWRQALLEGLSRVPVPTRDAVLKTVEEVRSVIPRMDLSFDDSPPRYEPARRVITFAGEALGQRVRCAISGEALDENFGTATGSTGQERLEKFGRNRSAIERMAAEKYLRWPVEEPESVLLKSADVPKLLAVVTRKRVGGHASVRQRSAGRQKD